MGIDRVIKVWEEILENESDEKRNRIASYIIFPDEAALLYAIARCDVNNLVLEIGTGYGFSTAHLAEALKDTGKEHLHLVTIDTSKTSHATKLIDKLGLSEWVTFVQGETPGCLGDNLKVHPKFKNLNHLAFDLAFIDGNHSVESTVNDYDTVVKYMRPRGKIVLHDTIFTGPANVLAREKERNRTIMHFPTHHGMAVIQIGEI